VIPWWLFALWERQRGEVVGAVRAGWEEILAVERVARYVRRIRDRVTACESAPRVAIAA